MELTDVQLNEIKDDYLVNKKTVMNWMNDNELGAQDIRPNQIMIQLRDKFGTDEIQSLMMGIRKANYGAQIINFVERMIGNNNLDVEMCDSLIEKIQDCLVTVQAKKAELEGE